MRRVALLGLLCAAVLAAVVAEAAAAMNPEVERECTESAPGAVEACEQEVAAATESHHYVPAAVRACWEVGLLPEQAHECASEVRASEREEQEEIREQEKARRKAAAARRHRAKLRREWAHKPTVTERIAHFMAVRTMRRAGYPYGLAYCQGGRINRTTWRCRIDVVYHGLHAEMRVWGAGYRNGTAFFGTHSGRLRAPPLRY